MPTLEDLYFTIRRQEAGTVGGPDALDPIAPSWASSPPAAPPQSAPFSGLHAPDSPSGDLPSDELEVSG